VREEKMMLFGIIGILLVIYLLFKTDVFSKKDGRYFEKDNDALEVLKKRYAEGLITQEEYIRMKDEINT
jgi:uncharacterized membrane protein